MLARTRGVAALALTASLAACASGAGGLGDILGSVLGGAGQGQGQGQSGQASGVITGVDGRRQEIGLQTSSGQTAALRYDGNTRVVYQQREYPVSALERGDRVTLRVRQIQGGEYYTDYVQVDQSVQERGGTSQQQARAFEGTVRQVDLNQGWFAVDTRGYGTLTVTLPYAVSRADNDRFRRLRRGDGVRFEAVPLNQTRVELQRFY